MTDELDIFLKDYERAANSCRFENVSPLISDDAVFWFTNGTFIGKRKIKLAFEDTWAKIKNEVYSISNVEWLVSDSDFAVCVYEFTSDGVVDDRHQVYEGRGTNVLKKSDGKWQIIHEHLSKRNMLE